MSMTGFGEARQEGAGMVCSVEVRSVNNRFLKIACKLPDGYTSLETEIERLVREVVKRGTVSVFVRIDAPEGPGVARINLHVLRGYLDQLRTLDVDPAHVVGHLLALPGVVDETAPQKDPNSYWPFLSSVIRQALTRLDAMRREEGAAMAKELLGLADRAERMLDAIAEHAPDVVRLFRDRMKDRISAALEESGVSIEDADLLREVAIFADRCDITEELSRLRSHLGQYREAVTSRESVGRKLEFLVQEMFRESNTIGSKANDAAISQWVIDLKSLIEQAKELIQNVE